MINGLHPKGPVDISVVDCTDSPRKSPQRSNFPVPKCMFLIDYNLSVPNRE